MKTARVLLVDDNPDHLGRLAVLLSEHYAVSSHGSAAEALREIDPVTPHVLVLGSRPSFDPRGLVTMIDRVLGCPLPENPTGHV
jgi:DNA-binding NtrC family response regulator